MFGLLALSTGALLALLTWIVALIVAAALSGTDNPETLARLRRSTWVRRLESLPPAELRFRGMVGLGAGLCCFAALLTLRLFAPLPAWTAAVVGLVCVAAITIGAAMLERAASADGWR